MPGLNDLSTGIKYLIKFLQENLSSDHILEKKLQKIGIYFNGSFAEIFSIMMKLFCFIKPQLNQWSKNIRILSMDPTM